MKPSFGFEVPRLRPGVVVERGAGALALLYRQQSCDIEVEAEHAGAIARFVDDLQRGRPLAELRGSHEALGETVDVLLEEFDRHGLIEESRYPRAPGLLTGRQHYAEVRALVETVKRRDHVVGQSMFERMRDGRIGRNPLIGYAAEYYQVVRFAPGLIAPALAKVENRTSRRILQKFLDSELYHDDLLARSLAAVGIDVDLLEQCQPLPSTFAICASLGVYAQQHALSFKALLFLFEEPSSQFNEAFVAACARHGLPKAFHEPIIRHAQINEAGEHDDVSRLLMAEVPVVGAEEALVVRKNAVNLVETLMWQEREILSAYDYAGDFRPRVRT